MSRKYYWFTANCQYHTRCRTGILLIPQSVDVEKLRRQMDRQTNAYTWKLPFSVLSIARSKIPWKCILYVVNFGTGAELNQNDVDLSIMKFCWLKWGQFIMTLSVWIFHVWFITNFVENETKSVADPGFSPGGAPTPKIAIIFHIFAENCMKMKEFGPPGGGARPWRPPWIRQCKR